MDELAKIRQRQLANAVHYIWETGEDKFAFRYFHTGFWESCEKHNDGETSKHTPHLLMDINISFPFQLLCILILLFTPLIVAGRREMPKLYRFNTW